MSLLTSASEIRSTDETTMGPLNNEPTAAKMDRHLEDAVGHGAEVVVGGSSRRRVPDEPLLRGDGARPGQRRRWRWPGRRPSARSCRSRRSRSEDEALAIIDSGPYGLLASIFTQDLRRGLRFAEAARAGWVNVNEGSNYWESHLPFGGRAGSKSGVGRVGGRHAMETFTEPKTVVLNLGS